MDPALFCNGTSPAAPMEWCIKTLQVNHVVMCYTQKMSQIDGLWRAENATNRSVPMFLHQLIIIICINRLLMVVFRALRLPRIAAEILGGVLLGAGGIAHTMFGKDYLYPYKSLMNLETFGNLSLLYYMFIVGLEVDMKPIIKAPKKVFSTAFAGFIIPFPVGYALHYLMVKNFDVVTKGYPTRHGPLFWGVALSTTNFPDLAQILSDLKLLRSEVGRTALSAAVITDFFSWILLVMSMAIVNNQQIFTVVFSASFVIFCLLFLRPALAWIIESTASAVEASGGYTNQHVSFVLALVVVFGYITDACGCHSILGGFMLGLIMPEGGLKERLIEKVEDFVSGLMMPMFFVIVGLRTNHVDLFAGSYGVGIIAAVVALAFLAKIFSTFFTAVFVNKMTPRDALALGLLMNTKGLLALIVISSARDLKVLDNDTFTVIITALWVMTVAVGPILRLTYRSAKPAGEEHLRTIASLEPHSEFRILTCFHSSREVSGVIKLLEASNPTRNSPISISAIHLIENLGRATAMLIVKDACNTGGVNDKEQLELIAAFEAMRAGRDPSTISVETLSAVSAYATMHEDICSLAIEKTANLIILPLHLSSDSSVEGTVHNSLRSVNKSVMERAKCTVSVLVDRGHRVPTKKNTRNRHFFMLFVGGPDDREALAYAERMSGSPGVRLTVTRFIPERDCYAELESDGECTEKALDERCVEAFLHETRAKETVSFTEEAVRDGEDIVKAINTMKGNGFDMVIVGRGNGRRSPLGVESGLWSEFPELGLLGDALLCSNFAATALILVVQQGGNSGRPTASVAGPRSQGDRHDSPSFSCGSNKFS